MVNGVVVVVVADVPLIELVLLVETYVSGTKWGVRLDIDGNIGLDGHWYEGVVTVAGTLLCEHQQFRHPIEINAIKPYITKRGKKRKEKISYYCFKFEIYWILKEKKTEKLRKQSVCVVCLVSEKDRKRKKNKFLALCFIFYFAFLSIFLLMYNHRWWKPFKPSFSTRSN